MSADRNGEREARAGMAVFTAALALGAGVTAGAILHAGGHHPAVSGLGAAAALCTGAAAPAAVLGRRRAARACFTAGVILAAAAVAAARLA